MITTEACDCAVVTAGIANAYADRSVLMFRNMNKREKLPDEMDLAGTKPEFAAKNLNQPDNQKGCSHEF